MTARTFLLLAVLTALFGLVGFFIAGEQGALLALLIAGGMNIYAYWFSDSLALSAHGARPVTAQEAPELHALVAELAGRAGLPMPKVCVIPSDQPNAFATGRNPDHGAVAVTQGLTTLLDRREVAAVIAHELGHIRNRDTLVMTVAATLAGALSMLASLRVAGRGRSNPIVAIAVMILAPLAATVVRMAISRTREYGADAAGSEICGDPQALADALQKIDAAARGTYNDAAERHPATAHMFIINPLSGEGIASLFSTHPATADRVAALQALARQRSFSGAPIQPSPSSRGAGRSVSGRRGPWGRR